MGIPNSEILHPKERRAMSAGLSLDSARRIAGECEIREQFRNGGSREDARKRLARRLGSPWSPGTLYNLARDRLKRLDADLRDTLSAYAVSDLEADIQRLHSDLEAARALGRAQDPAHVRKVVAAYERARRLYEDATGCVP